MRPTAASVARANRLQSRRLSPLCSERAGAAKTDHFDGAAAMGASASAGAGARAGGRRRVAQLASIASGSKRDHAERRAVPEQLSRPTWCRKVYSLGLLSGDQNVTRQTERPSTQRVSRPGVMPGARALLCLAASLLFPLPPFTAPSGSAQSAERQTGAPPRAGWRSSRHMSGAKINNHFIFAL